MKEIKRALAIQGALMLLISIFAYTQKPKSLSQKQAFVFGTLGLMSLEASHFLKSDITIRRKKGT
ncbi:MAG TPA: hypothetical protein VFD08_02270 [Clostridia bacterium]|nr:hypothetical protein [Clostridia bacterium]